MEKATEAASKAMGKAKKAAGKLQGETGIYTTLREEHGEVSALMKRVMATRSDDAKKRQELFNKIRAEVLSHAKAEEQEFYSLLYEHSETHDMAQHSKEEHDEIESFIRELDTMNPAGEQWLATFKKLQQSIEHHVKEEEGKLFDLAQKVFSSAQAKDIDKRFQHAKQGRLKEFSR